MRTLPFFAIACGPYATWSDADAIFPAVYTPETELEDWEHVRWETETWDPWEDTTSAARYLLKAANHRKGAPIESLEHFAQMQPTIPSLGDGLRLSVVGDVMWIGDNWDAYALPVAHLLDGDLRVGNLETPTSPDHPTGLGDLGLYSFNAPPQMLDGLPLDLLQLNNNHSIDAGDEGLEATIAEAEARGFLHTGVDEHAVVEVGGRRIAFLAYTWGLNIRDSTSTHELFVVPFGHVDAVSMDRVAEDATAAREAGADTVVALLHWGFEYEYYPDPHFMVLARDAIRGGVDLIVGSGPHVVQPPEVCHVNRPEKKPGIGTCSVRTDDGFPRTAAVLYSLGNFGTAMPTIPCQVGLVATASLDPDVTGLEWSAVATVVENGQSKILPLSDISEDSKYTMESDRLDVHLGTHWKR